MTKAYLNYPVPHITLHGDQSCAQIGKMGKPNQRHVQVTPTSFTQAIQTFTGTSFRLGANAAVNDVWISVDFGDSQFEEAVVGYILRLLIGEYSWLAQASIKRHC